MPQGDQHKSSLWLRLSWLASLWAAEKMCLSDSLCTLYARNIQRTLGDHHCVLNLAQVLQQDLRSTGIHLGFEEIRAEIERISLVIKREFLSNVDCDQSGAGSASA